MPYDARGSRSSSTRSPREPTPHPRLLADRGGQRLAGGEGVLGVPVRRARRRCGARRRPSPATGRAARPARRSRAPARRRRRASSGTRRHRSARPGQISSVRSRSSSRWAGCTLARRPSAASRRDVGARHQLGVLDRAARAGRGVGVERRGHRGVADRVGGHLEPGHVGAGEQRDAARAAARLGAPLGCSRRPLSAYGSQHQAVRVLSEPSLMILSGPITSRSSPLDERRRRCAGRPRRRPRAPRRRSPSARAAGRTPACQRSIHSAAPPENSKSTSPTTPSAAAACEAVAVGRRRGAGVAGEACRAARRPRTTRSRAPRRRAAPSPSAARAALLSQAWWASPAISTTGVTPETASSSADGDRRGPGAGPVARSRSPGGRARSATRSATSATRLSGE